MGKKKIIFKDTGETFSIKAMDDRYMICVRLYTKQERKAEIDKYDKAFEEFLKEAYQDELDGYVDFEDFCEDKEVYTKLENLFHCEQGERPEELKEDTFAYTIVDAIKKMRGPDNFYCKFNYHNQKECQKALEELNTVTKETKGTTHEEYELQISRRNSIPLSSYEVRYE